MDTQLEFFSEAQIILERFISSHANVNLSSLEFWLHCNIAGYKHKKVKALWATELYVTVKTRVER